MNKDYENRWEFDPDEIVNENDQIMSLTIASRLVVRTSPFPDVCGGSDLSVATLEREVAEVEETGVKGKNVDSKTKENPNKVLAFHVKEETRLRGAFIEEESSKSKHVSHKVREHFP